VGVSVKVDEPRCDVQPGGVDDLAATRGGDVRRHPPDTRSADGDVHHGVDAVRRIDHVAALEQQVVSLPRQKRSGEKERGARTSVCWFCTVHALSIYTTGAVKREAMLGTLVREH